MTELRILYDGPGLVGKSTSLGVVRAVLARHYAVTGGSGRLSLQGPGVTIDVACTPAWLVVDPVREELRARAHVFVVVLDSQPERMEANVEVIDQLAALPARPMVLQFNKRDLPNILPLDELGRELNPHSFPAFESIATRGVGTMEAFHTAAIFAAKLAGCSDELRALLATAPSRTH